MSSDNNMLHNDNESENQLTYVCKNLKINSIVPTTYVVMDGLFTKESREYKKLMEIVNCSSHWSRERELIDGMKYKILNKDNRVKIE